MNNTKLLTIHTRPEIRKGCVWEIQLKLSPDLVKSENIQQIYIEKPRGLPNNNKTEHHLCMKVRSKLIKPVRELAFSKVAAIVNEGETIECNENGVVTLRVRFTARPRAVFHKHSDMMILIVAVRRGDVTVCSDQKELIFRGGTGSVHSADNRQQFVPAVIKGPKIKREPGDNTPDSPSGDDVWAGEMPEFEDFDSGKFCTDFMQNKGDSLLGFGGQSSADNYDFGDIDISNNTLGSAWPSEEDFGGTFNDVKFNPHDVVAPATSCPSARIDAPSPLGDSSSATLTSALTPVPVIPSPLSSSSSTTTASAPVALAHNSKFTLVHGKRRGSCTHCKSECSFYRGEGGPCEECGCFPARHLDVDKPTRTSKRKREATADDDEDDDEDGRRKRLRYTLETKYFQKLFFNCLHYLSLVEISSICARAPVPVFIKDSNSVYLYVNSTFCNFVLDLTRSDQIVNQTTSQVLGRHEAAEIVAQEQELMLGEEGKPKEFNVTVKKQNFRVMKQWSTLRDGQRVIIGAVVSAY